MTGGTSDTARAIHRQLRQDYGFDPLALYDIQIVLDVLQELSDPPPMPRFRLFRWLP